jgi:hypothetical protein
MPRHTLRFGKARKGPARDMRRRGGPEELLRVGLSVSAPFSRLELGLAYYIDSSERPLSGRRFLRSVIIRSGVEKSDRYGT